MSETIFLLDEKGKLVEMNESGFLTEDQFQKLLAEYPNLLSGSQIDPERPRRWLLISREIGIADSENSGGRWSLDHLFLDQDAIPTLVEVKRSTDTRLRREVVGQILDYAANGVSYWKIEEIQQKFEDQCRKTGREPSEAMRDFLEHDGDESLFWANVQTNLKAGKIRMLIVADAIPRELQRVIEFLNGQMSPAEILGVEIKQFLGQNLKTLVPRVVGQTAVAQSVKSTARVEAEQWTEAAFLALYSKIFGTEEATLVSRILDWFRPRVTEIVGGKGQILGQLFPVIRKKPNALWPIFFGTNGAIRIPFDVLKKRPYFADLEARKAFLQKINLIKGVNISTDKLKGMPDFRISLLQNEAALTAFFEAMDWFFEQVKGH